MLPSVCALALLPQAGKVYVPIALQHLMEPGSPVADLYGICDTCDQLAAEALPLEQVQSPLTQFVTAVSLSTFPSTDCYGNVSTNMGLA